MPKELFVDLSVHLGNRIFRWFGLEDFFLDLSMIDVLFNPMQEIYKNHPKNFVVR